MHSLRVLSSWALLPVVVFLLTGIPAHAASDSESAIRPPLRITAAIEKAVAIGLFGGVMVAAGDSLFNLNDNHTRAQFRQPP